MKLSEQIKHCMDGNGCDKCENFVTRSKLTCPGLMQKAYEQIREYEKLEEQGRVHITDLSFGQKVYSIEDNNVIDEYKIVEMSMKCGDVVYISVAENGKFKLFDENDIGKAVYLIKSDAETALQKMNETEE